MKKLILTLTIIFATNCFASAGDGTSSITSAGDGTSSITSAGDGTSSITSAGDGTSSITSAGDGTSSITSIRNVQFMQLGNGFIRSCFQIQNNATACSIIKQ